jgi:hypothetical protein
MSNVLKKTADEISDTNYNKILNTHIVLSVFVYLGLFGLSDILIKACKFNTKQKIIYYTMILIITGIYMFFMY